LAANPAKVKLRSEDQLDKQFFFKGLGTAGKERRIVRLWRKRKRLAIPFGECSWIVEPWG